MDTRTVDFADMHPAAYNPREELKPGENAWNKLDTSIREFGYVEPIIWNEKTGNIVGGHQRYNVLKDAGYDSADCVVVNLSERDEKRLNLALNKVKGRWDIPMLTDLLDELNGIRAMGPTGFEDWELESLQVQYDHINDLMEESFSDFSPTKDRDKFDITFSIPLEAENVVREYIENDKNGKVKLSAAIVNHVKGLE